MSVKINLPKWQSYQLGDLFQIKHGYAFESAYFANQGEYILLTPGNFYEEGGFRAKGASEKYYTGDFPQEYLLKQNDLLIVMTEQAAGLLGSSLLVPTDNRYLHNQRLGLIWGIEETKLNKSYLYHLFNSQDVREQIHVTASGTKVRHTSPSKIYQVEIHIPSIHEQQKIAEILSSWDEAIDLTEQLMAAKKRRKQALMQRLLTGKVRFWGLEWQPWREVLLGEIFTERTEIGYAHLPLLAITSEQGIVHRDTLEKRDTSSEDKSKYLRICPGDIGYNTMRMWQGVSAVSRFEGIVSPAYTICIPNQDEIDVNFMGYLFKFAPIVHLFWRFSQGLVDDTRNLKFDNFAQIKVRIPHKEEQQKIAGVLEMCDQEITLLQQKLSALRQQKQGLMQQLLTGKIRVKV